jgi:protein SCO1/2
MKPNAIKTQTPKVGILALTLGAVAFASAQDAAQEPDRKNESPLARTMGITQRLGETVPKDATFKDEDGKTIHFGDLLHGRPIVLIPIFYACRTGCPLVTDSVMKTLAKAGKAEDELIPGRDLDVVLLSIHPKETPELARAKKNLILNAMEPPNAPEGWRNRAEKGWHLLTGSLESIHQVTNAIGFKYKYDPKYDLINHPTCTVILTPTGRISSYTIGNAFPTVVAKEDLATAAKDAVGEKADQSMMFGCIMLDPTTGKYRVVVENVLRLLGALTVIVLVTSIVWMTRTSKRDERESGLDRARTFDH